MKYNAMRITRAPRRPVILNSDGQPQVRTQGAGAVGGRVGVGNRMYVVDPANQRPPPAADRCRRSSRRPIARGKPPAARSRDGVATPARRPTAARPSPARPPRVTRAQTELPGARAAGRQSAAGAGRNRLRRRAGLHQHDVVADCVDRLSEPRLQRRPGCRAGAVRPRLRRPLHRATSRSASAATPRSSAWPASYCLAQETGQRITSLSGGGTLGVCFPYQQAGQACNTTADCAPPLTCAPDDRRLPASRAPHQRSTATRPPKICSMRASRSSVAAILYSSPSASTVSLRSGISIRSTALQPPWWLRSSFSSATS